MADTTTANLGLTKPEVGASSDTWGTKLNANFDTIDAIVSQATGANGTCTRYASGSQVCEISASFSGGTYTWTFPQAFIVRPSVVATCVNAAAFVGTTVGGVSQGADGTTTPIYGWRADGSATDTTSFHAIAKGRWK